MKPIGIFAFVCIFVAIATSALNAAQAVTDESLKTAMLEAVFPNATIASISVQPTEYPPDGEARDPALFFPDALKSEDGYRVTAPLIDGAEKCAASDAASGQATSDTRDLRFLAYAWPGARDPTAEILVVAQYTFEDAHPPGSCTSIARLAHVFRRDGQWYKQDDLVLNTTHHGALQRIQLLDLGRDNVDDLIVESDYGGAGGIFSNLVVFSLRKGTFEQWLNVPSRSEAVFGEQYVQTLDIIRTLRERAQTFCFTKTVFATADQWLKKPSVSKPCYQRFTGELAKVE